MSDPNMPPPPPPSTPPPGQGWQSQPQQPGPPPPMGGGPMGGGMPSWTSNITARGTMAGPGGLALADNVDRIIAWIIDAIIVGIVGYIVATITTSILGESFLGIFGLGYKQPTLISALLAVVIMLAATAGYFVYMWTRMGGATVGMRVMKLSVRDASSGGPISQNQALYRWAFLAAPLAIYWGLWGYGFLALLAGLLLLIWEIYLIYTVANSPTRQGFHDQYAKTVVAKVM